MADFLRAEYTVSGHVQGVGYRYFAARHAAALGIGGYAKNLIDGSVRIVAEADGNILKEFMKYLREGPSRAYVDNVKVICSDYTGEFRGFEIR